MQNPVRLLSLRDGTIWHIEAFDPCAWEYVYCLSKVMGLNKDEKGDRAVSIESNWRLRAVGTDDFDTWMESNSSNLLRDARVIVDNCDTNPCFVDKLCWKLFFYPSEGTYDCILIGGVNSGSPAGEAMILSSVIGAQAQMRAGLLIHGALLEHRRKGIVLAGPGGVGKSTACARVQPPWKAHCDDTTLIVRDPGGIYWAHPWPTWSTFMDGGEGGVWNVEDAVELTGIFFIRQAEEDKVESAGRGEALCLLLETAAQASHLMTFGMTGPDRRAHHLQRFKAAEGVARVIPCYHLHLSRTGTFWREIEAVMPSFDISP